MHTAELTVAIALAVGVLAQSISRQLRLPGIVLLLGTGALLGPDGLAWVDPRMLGDGLFGIVDFGIAIILFEGGLNLGWSRLKRQEAAIRRLITLGALVTVMAATGLARQVMGWSWEIALLFGSLVVVTGPTVVGPLLRDMRLRPRLRTVLEAEGVFIDPIGALLAVAVLQVVTAPAVATLTAEVRLIVASLGFGVAVGVVAGLILVFAMRHRSIVSRGYEHIFTLAAVVLLFEACGAVVAESGLMAVTVAGVVVGNLEKRVGDELREFKDRLTVMFVGLLFILLAADVPLDDLRGLGNPGLLVVGGLILVARPLSVWLSTSGLDLPVRERLFMSAIAPRGIVAVAVTTLTVATLDSQRIEGGDELKALVFLVIAATVVISGISARPLSWLLDVRLPRRDRVAILGARGLAIPLAEQLRNAGRTVVFIEPDPKRSRAAEEAGYSVIFGDPLEERTMLRARPELVGIAVGLTFNEHLNTLFVREALESFGVPKGLVATESLYGEQAPSLLPPENADVLFDGSHDHERWDARWRRGEVTVEPFVYQLDADGDSPDADADEKKAPSRSRGLCVIIAVQRGSHVEPMRRGYAFKAGDVASVAIYTPEREAAEEQLAKQGWVTAPTAPASTDSPA